MTIGQHKFLLFYKISLFTLSSPLIIVPIFVGILNKFPIIFFGAPLKNVHILFVPINKSGLNIPLLCYIISSFINSFTFAGRLGIYIGLVIIEVTFAFIICKSPFLHFTPIRTIGYFYITSPSKTLVVSSTIFSIFKFKFFATL